MKLNATTSLGSKIKYSYSSKKGYSLSLDGYEVDGTDYDSYYEYLAGLVPPPDPLRGFPHALVIGAGVGNLTKVLSPNYRVTDLEFDEELYDICHFCTGNPQGDYKWFGDAYKVTVINRPVAQPFDAIFSEIGLLSSPPVKAILGMLTGCKSMLAANGVMVAQVHHGRLEKDPGVVRFEKAFKQVFPECEEVLSGQFTWRFLRSKSVAH